MTSAMPAPADLSLASGADILHLANARLVLPDEVRTGSLIVADGRIAEIAPGTHVGAGAIDCDGDYITPGLIELHTDNLERHIEPRPSVDWPHLSAILAHDGELASTGITTVFDAMRVGSIHTGKGGYVKYARALTDEILALRRADALRISHFLHLRAEICSETLLEELAEFTPEDRIGIVSLMDHTPGQRQFRDLSKLKTYIAKKRGMSDTEFEAHVTHLKGLRARLGDGHETGAIAEARRLGAVLASHDDTTAEQVATSHGNGVGFAEFPTTHRGRRGLPRTGRGDHDGGAQHHPGRLAFGQCQRAGPGEARASGYRVVRLRALGAAAVGVSAGRSLAGPAPRHPHRHRRPCRGDGADGPRPPDRGSARRSSAHPRYQRHPRGAHGLEPGTASRLRVSG